MQTPAPTGAPTPLKGHRLFGEGVDPRGPGRVLVVANDKAVQSVLATLTTIEGCEAIASSHGLQAQYAIHTWQPRVILLDLDDLGDNAVEFVRAYREAASHDIPIIVLSTDELEDDQTSEIGAAAALPKPFSAAELLELLRRFAHCSG